MKKIFKVILKLIFIIISFAEKGINYLKKIDIKSRMDDYGENLYIGSETQINCKNIEVGKNVYIGKKCIIQSSKAKVSIGNNVMIAPEVSIHAGNHRIDVVGKYMNQVNLEEKRESDDLDIVIEDDVWIGTRAIILNGVTIGEGAVIGAGSVVTKSVEAYTIYTGAPNLKQRKRWNDNEINLHKIKINLNEKVKV